MEVSPEALDIAKKKKQNDEDLMLCLRYLVCPKCGGDLKPGTFPNYLYTCSECSFKFTSIQESKLQQRLKNDREN